MTLSFDEQLRVDSLCDRFEQIVRDGGSVDAVELLQAADAGTATMAIPALLSLAEEILPLNAATAVRDSVLEYSPEFAVLQCCRASARRPGRCPRNSSRSRVTD